MRSSFTCVLQGKKPPKANDAGILEIGNAGRSIRFVCNHKFYDFLYPQAEGVHRFQGSSGGGMVDVFLHAELGLVRTGRRAEQGRAPIERSLGEIVDMPGVGFEFRLEDQAPFQYVA